MLLAGMDVFKEGTVVGKTSGSSIMKSCDKSSDMIEIGSSVELEEVEAEDLKEVEAEDSEEVEAEVTVAEIIFPTLSLLLLVSSIYDSATALDFHPPWRFTVKKSAPPSANTVADVRRKEWPVYSSGFGSLKNFAMVFGIAPNVLMPITWLTHRPF